MGIQKQGAPHCTVQWSNRFLSMQNVNVIVLCSVDAYHSCMSKKSAIAREEPSNTESPKTHLFDQKSNAKNVKGLSDRKKWDSSPSPLSSNNVSDLFHLTWDIAPDNSHDLDITTLTHAKSDPKYDLTLRTMSKMSNYKEVLPN